MASKKTIDQCLADFHGCMTTSTLAPAPRAASAPAARAASAPAARTASAPAARAVSNYVMKPGVSAYGGDPNLASKRLNVVTGTVDQCKAACDANAKCTHFTQTGSSCQLYSGGEWVGTQPGTNSYCKSQCQGGGGTSGYAMEGSPFGGVVSTGRNTKLILTLLVLAILLWILAKNM